VGVQGGRILMMVDDPARNWTSIWSARSTQTAELRLPPLSWPRWLPDRPATPTVAHARLPISLEASLGFEGGMMAFNETPKKTQDKWRP
jgi:hypothetical protein